MFEIGVMIRNAGLGVERWMLGVGRFFSITLPGFLAS
jgi:hypothetical protein